MDNETKIPAAPAQGGKSLQQALIEANSAISEFEAEVQTMKASAKRLFDAVLSPNAESKIIRVMRAGMR